MQDLWNSIWEYKWIVLAGIAAAIFFIVATIRKFKPLMDVAKEHKHMEEQYSQLTVQKLENLDDDTLVKAIMYNMWSQMADDMSDEFDVVDKQNDYKKAVYTVIKLNEDFNDGGFEQIYLTPSAKFGRISSMAYESINAPLSAKVMKTAYEIYFDHRDVFDKATRLGENDAYLFDEADQQMQTARESEDAKKLCADYIRSNLDEICK